MGKTENKSKIFVRKPVGKWSLVRRRRRRRWKNNIEIDFTEVGS
jgi:hypothetical protein